ncbi:glucosamine-6-phosphate deaminase [Haploplasma axanthum]|uniref:Glucosamine-6-phosphate deaminase n=1 Tax=Haploplasma axanthum TaxID=29552 RepID=A0A449BBV0_HAPAX|nr:glucosamine-6-phosphate deaminase [Haploplasma axanthum]VEU79745.1 Glucosamine-6-phosphate deaminase 1 [Haploplasma axanthum]
MELYIKDNKEAVNNEVSSLIIDLVKKNKNAILGLATGSTPIGVYNELALDYKNNKTDYSNVKTVNLDEYINLPKEHSQSYYSFMNQNLFSKINIKKENTFLPNGNGENHLESCSEYELILKNHKPDIQILGIGSNGHIGFNEPGTSFDSTTHIVELKESTRLDNARFFNSLDEVPTHSITMGIKSILQAKTIVLIAFGKNKADAVYKMIKGPITDDCPASILQTHPNVKIFLDKEAASLL